MSQGIQCVDRVDDIPSHGKVKFGGFGRELKAAGTALNVTATQSTRASHTSTTSSRASW